MKNKTTLAILATILLLAVMPIFASSGEMLPTLEDSVFGPQVRPIFFDAGNVTALNPVPSITVSTLEDLYAAVNDTENAGTTINLAAGLYMLSQLAPGGAARPNGGRLDFQTNMSLIGVSGDRNAVIIDAADLPSESYVPEGLPNTGAIRMGRGTNSLEWLTLRNAVNGAAGIETDINTGATSFVRIAHIVSTGNVRGIDIRNVGDGMTGRMVVAQIIDNDLFSNQIDPGFAGRQGLRVVNGGAPSGVLIVEMSGNRCYDNQFGLIVENNAPTTNGFISVKSTRDRFYQNGLGASIGGGFSGGFQPANDNTTIFSAYGSSFDNNNGANDFFPGGLKVFGALTLSQPFVTSRNTVQAALYNCFLSNNQFFDLSAVGALSLPETIGSPGNNNSVRIYMRGVTPPTRVQTFVDSIPHVRGDMNTAALTGVICPKCANGDSIF